MSKPIVLHACIQEHNSANPLHSIVAFKNTIVAFENTSIQEHNSANPLHSIVAFENTIADGIMEQLNEEALLNSILECMHGLQLV